MSEEIKRKWDVGKISAVRAWYESSKGFDQIEKETNLPAGTLFKLVNEIPDYRGTRQRRQMAPELRIHLFRNRRYKITDYIYSSLYGKASFLNL